jgi:hypothetical protein
MKLNLTQHQDALAPTFKVNAKVNPNFKAFFPQGTSPMDDFGKQQEES